MNYGKTGYLISPFENNHQFTPKVAEYNSTCLLDRSLMEDASISDTNPPYSPWMHTSVLGMALGGGDESPDWMSPSKMEVYRTENEQYDSHHSVDSFKDENCKLDLTRNLNDSECAKLELGESKINDQNDIDALVGLMNGVDVNDSQFDSCKFNNLTNYLNYFF